MCSLRVKKHKTGLALWSRLLSWGDIGGQWSRRSSFWIRGDKTWKWGLRFWNNCSYMKPSCLEEVLAPKLKDGLKFQIQANQFKTKNLFLGTPILTVSRDLGLNLPNNLSKNGIESQFWNGETLKLSHFHRTPWASSAWELPSCSALTNLTNF